MPRGSRKRKNKLLNGDKDELPVDSIEIIDKVTGIPKMGSEEGGHAALVSNSHMDESSVKAMIQKTLDEQSKCKPKCNENVAQSSTETVEWKMDESSVKAIIQKALEDQSKPKQGGNDDQRSIEAFKQKMDESSMHVDTFNSTETLGAAISKIVDEKTAELKTKYESEINFLKRTKYMCPFYGNCQCCHFWSNGEYPLYDHRGNHGRGGGNRGGGSRGGGSRGVGNHGSRGRYGGFKSNFEE